MDRQTDTLEIDAVQKSARPMYVVEAGGAGVPVSWGVWEQGMTVGENVCARAPHACLLELALSSS